MSRRYPTGWAHLVALGRRTDIGAWAVAMTLLAVVSFGVVAGPRWMRDAEADSLAQAVSDAPLGARQLAVRVLADFPPGFLDDPLELQRRRLDDIDAEIAPDLLDRFEDRRFVADTSRFTVALERFQSVDDGADAGTVPAEPALPTFLTFRVHPELDDHSLLVAGRRAAATDRTVGGLDVMEFELAEDAAAALGWELGDVVVLTVDPSDPVTRSFNTGLPADFAGELVGIRRLDDPSDRYWFGDRRLHRPAVSDTALGADVFAYATIHAEQLPTRPFLVERRSPFALEERHDLDPSAITLSNADATLDGVVQLEAGFSTQPTLTRPGVVSGLRPVLEIEAEQRAAARTVVALASTGVLAVAVTTLVQVLGLSTRRRRGLLDVAKARGASGRQIVAAAVTEWGALAGAAVLLGVGGALAVAPRAAAGPEWVLSAATWSGAVVSAAVVAWAEGRRPVTARPDDRHETGRRGRAFGVFLVAVAAASLVTFRRRGIDVDGIDPFALAVVVLVPLALVTVSVRAVPRLFGRLGRRGLALGVGRLVGVRRLAESPGSTVGVVSVTVLALAVAGLGLGVDRALVDGAVDASWVSVGAPYRIDTRDEAVRADLLAVPDAVVAASGSTRINVEHEGDAYGTTLVTLDVSASRTITAGTAVDGRLPTELEFADADGAIPVVASRRVNGRLVRVGDRFDGIGSRDAQVFRVVAVTSSLLGRTNDFLAADRTVVALVSGTEPGFDTLAIAAPSRRDLAAIADRADEVLVARSDVLEAGRSDPLARAVRIGYLASAGLALLLAVVAAVAVAVLTARERRREVSVLGLLGARRSEIHRAVVAELVPAAVFGGVLGFGAGWALTASFAGRFDLSSFAGGVPVSVRAVPVLLATAAIGLVTVTLLLVVGVVRRTVDAEAAEIVRIEGAG